MTTTSGALPPVIINGIAYPDRGYCRTPDGGLHRDGPVIHTTYCHRGTKWGDTAVSGSDCIHYGQDGPAIQADRAAAADRRRFTPPEYRERHMEPPGPTIRLNQHQPVDVVALRGCPRGPDGKGAGEWTTWENFTAPTGDDLAAALERITDGPQPVEMNRSQAAAIVREFTNRVPGYEFKIVRARLTIDEKTLA